MSQAAAAQSQVQPGAAQSDIGRGQEIPVRLRGRFVPDESLLSQELRRKLWEGMIALKIDLAIDDQFSMEKPRSLYVSRRFLSSSPNPTNNL